MMLRHDPVMEALKRRYREPAASEKKNPWETLLFTALTARSRDEQVEPVFQRMMRRWPGPEALASATAADVGTEIKSIGLWQGKAKNAVAMAKAVVSRHGGQVPNDLDALVALP